MYRLALPLMSLVFSLNVLAETPTHGRTEDGRPYRIDKQGFQVIDQMAELEVTIDDLKQQVLSLENEVEDKNNLISSLKSNAPQACQGLIENSVVETQAVSQGEITSCDKLVLPLQTEIRKLENQLVVNRAQSEEQCEQVTEPLHQQITKLQTALMSSPSKEQLAKEESRSTTLKERVGKLARRAEESEQIASDAQERIGHLESALEQSTAKERRLSQQIAKLEASNQELSGSRKSRASMERSGVRAKNRRLAPRSTRKPRESILSKSAIAKAKKSFKTQLSSIQNSIMKRKNMLDKLKSKRSDIKVSAQSLVSLKGNSLDTLRTMAKQAKTPSQVQQVRQELEEIAKILEEDLEVFKRLSS